MATPSPVHGRGAQSGAVPTRFGLAGREADGDWLDMREGLDGPGPKLPLKRPRRATGRRFWAK